MNSFRKKFPVFLLLLLTFQVKTSALYVGNPALPNILQEGLFFSKDNAISIKTAYQRDWVFNMNMKAVSNISGAIDDFTNFSDQGVILVNFFNHISLYGSIGAMRIYASHIPRAGVQNMYQTDNQLTWGIGGRATPSIKWMTQNGTPFTPNARSSIDFNQWQIGLGASYQISIFYPYLSVKYLNANSFFNHLPAHFFSNTNHFKTSNRKKFGIALGTTISTGSIFDLSVEAQLIDQEAFTLTGEIRF